MRSRAWDLKADWCSSDVFSATEPYISFSKEKGQTTLSTPYVFVLVSRAGIEPASY